MQNTFVLSTTEKALAWGVLRSQNLGWFPDQWLLLFSPVHQPPNDYNFQSLEGKGLICFEVFAGSLSETLFRFLVAITTVIAHTC